MICSLWMIVWNECLHVLWWTNVRKSMFQSFHKCLLCKQQYLRIVNNDCSLCVCARIIYFFFRWRQSLPETFHDSIETRWNWCYSHTRTSRRGDYFTIQLIILCGKYSTEIIARRKTKIHYTHTHTHTHTSIWLILFPSNLAILSILLRKFNLITSFS